MNQALKDAIGSHVPLEVYLRSSEYEPDAEYVDGRVEERSMGEIDHAAWQRTIMKWFLLHEDEFRFSGAAPSSEAGAISRSRRHGD